VHFRIEGWIWGPSLDGFRREEDEATGSAAEPPMPLLDATPRIRRFVESLDGTFYSVEYDADLQRITLRFRVRALDPEALAAKQMKIQRRLLDILLGKLDFARIRVESNRVDGGGHVGLEVAEIDTSALAVLDPGDRDGWREAVRLSHDGGRTWDE
jgi:hypothetical protein